MHNELTKMDLKKMQEELDYRRITLRPQLLEEVKVARSFGDLSENFEYKAAKRDKNKNLLYACIRCLSKPLYRVLPLRV